MHMNSAFFLSLTLSLFHMNRIFANHTKKSTSDCYFKKKLRLNLMTFLPSAMMFCWNLLEQEASVKMVHLLFISILFTRVFFFKSPFYARCFRSARKKTYIIKCVNHYYRLPTIKGLNSLFWYSFLPLKAFKIN